VVQLDGVSKRERRQLGGKAGGRSGGDASDGSTVGFAAVVGGLDAFLVERSICRAEMVRRKQRGGGGASAKADRKERPERGSKGEGEKKGRRESRKNTNLREFQPGAFQDRDFERNFDRICGEGT
jgi:hypothetical protein